MTRLGLCCTFIEEPIRFRTATATYVLKLQDRLTYLDEIVTSNVHALERAIEYCQIHGIGSFRVNSQFLPLATHPDLKYRLHDLPSASLLKKGLKKCYQDAITAHVRLTFHPDQFVNLSSERDEVIQNSINELEYQAEIADLMGADVINIHGGGGYKDKPAALKRVAENFKRLSKRVRTRLTLENDDRVYTPSDLLPLCKELKIPLVYDVHHHRCLKDRMTIEEATSAALSTWDREPLFHISSALEGWKGPKPHRHHDFIDIKDLPECWKKIDPLTIEVEAKSKEKAVLKLLKDLSKEGWNFSP